MQDCPIIADIITSFNNAWPIQHTPLLKQIIDICRAPYNVAASEVEFLHGVTTGTDQTGQVTYHNNRHFLEPWEEGQWYPHWPKLRSCKLYPNYYTAVPEPAHCKHNCKFLTPTNIFEADARWQKYFDSAKKNSARVCLQYP
jgi:hypothetical protein